ncbi:MAG TPA: hypothetical protein VFV49_04360 [Thermoanaerobaculia bacterium]|nr:hypothetical protein [Thermoanaerobaculia bacterium]
MKQRILFAVLFTLLAAACSRETPSATATADTAGTASETATATHPASPGGAALVPDVAAGTTVLVVLEDNSLALPGQAIPSGPAVLTVENRGSGVHNLYIEGEGINRAAGDNIEAGRSATVDVLFKPGTYTFYCPVLNHRENGEQATITIAAP